MTEKLWWIYFKETDPFQYNPEQKTGIRGEDEGDVTEKFWVQMANDCVKIISVEPAPDWLNSYP